MKFLKNFGRNRRFCSSNPITVDYYSYRELQCRIDETRYTNFDIFTSNISDVLVLPCMVRPTFHKVMYSVLKKCEKLEFVYWVLSSDFDQLNLIDSLSTKRLKRWCPSLKNAFLYENNLVSNFFTPKLLQGTGHLKFSYMLREQYGTFWNDQISNFVEFVSKSDLSALKSLSFEFIKELAGVLPLLVTNAKNLQALEILTTSEDSGILTQADFETLSKFKNIKRLKIRTHSRLAKECGLEVLIDKCSCLEKFHVSQPLEDIWYYALQSNANTNSNQRLEILSWYGSEHKLSPNIKHTLKFTNYCSTGFRLEQPGNHVKFYSYNF